MVSVVSDQWSVNVMFLCVVECRMTDSRVTSVVHQTGLSQSQATDLLRGETCRFHSSHTLMHTCTLSLVFVVYVTADSISAINSHSSCNVTLFMLLFNLCRRCSY